MKKFNLVKDLEKALEILTQAYDETNWVVENVKENLESENIMIFDNQVEFVKYAFKLDELSRDELLDLFDDFLNVNVDQDDVIAADSVITSIYDDGKINFTVYQDWEDDRNYPILIKDFNLIVEGKDNE